MSIEESLEAPIESIRILHIEPGDVLVLEHPSKLGRDYSQRLRDRIAEILKDNGYIDFKIIVLEEGMRVSALLKKGTCDETGL